MNIGFKIMAFMICLNVAAGIMNNLLPELTTTVSYDTATQTKLGIIANTSIDPSGSSGSNPETYGDRVMDFIGLGWINQIKDLAYNFLFGITNFLQKMFNIFGVTLGTVYIVFINIAISFAYVLAMVLLWTGKRLNK